MIFNRSKTKPSVKAFAKKAICLLTAITVGIAVAGAGHVKPIASGMTDAGITGSKLVTPTHLDESNRETTVTLSLPAVTSTDEYDVVFVMDDSSSTTLASGTFITRVTNLLDGILAAGADVNVGVAKFKGLAYDAISLASSGAYSGLVKYTTASASSIMDGIRLNTFTPASSGTNIHGGLKLANSWLSADTDVADNHKYVILLTDGKTYVWNDNNDVATTIYVQAGDASFTLDALPKTGNQTANKSKQSLATNSTMMSAFTTFFGTFNPFLVGYAADANNGLASEYQALYDYNADPALLAELSGTSPYDTRSYYAYKEDGGTAALDGTATVANVTNGANLANSAWNKHPVFTPNADSSSYSYGARYLEFDPYEVISNGDGTYSYDFTRPNPDFYLNHVDATQKATYLSGHLWTDMGEKYNTAVLGYTSSYSGGRQNQQAFLKWLLQPTISDYAANTSDSTGLDTLFSSIENDINYLIKSGTVTDVITDDFTLVEDGTNTFTVKLDSTTLTATAAGAYHWTFGTAVAGVYPYEVSYDKAAKKVVWKINVPVENSKPVSLSYKLELDDSLPSGDYNTNVSATLDYTAFNNNTGTFTFPVPQVDYTYDPITSFKLKKTYVGGDGYDNAAAVVTAAGTLAEDISFTVAPYQSFNREVGKTAIPAFTPGTYVIHAGSGTEEVEVALPDYSTAGIGDYWYTVTETAGNTAGVTYDTTVYYLHVSVVHMGANVAISQVQLHKSAPAADGTYLNRADQKTDTLTNKYSAGSLTVQKTVTGNMADKNKPFNIDVTFTAPTGKTVTGDITYGMNTIAGGWTGNKTVSLSLTSGSSVQFDNIPDGVTYTVKETDYSADGYDIPTYAFDNASETGDTIANDSTWAGTYAAGTIGDSADTVTVTNNKTVTLDVGVILKNAPYIALIALIAATLPLVLRKRRSVLDE